MMVPAHQCFEGVLCSSMYLGFIHGLSEGDRRKAHLSLDASRPVSSRAAFGLHSLDFRAQNRQTLINHSGVPRRRKRQSQEEMGRTAGSLM